MPNEVVITNEAIYQIALETKEQVGILVATLPVQQADHEKRIRWLEHAMWKIIGAAGFAGAASGIFGAYLVNYILHKP